MNLNQTAHRLALALYLPLRTILRERAAAGISVESLRLTAEEIDAIRDSIEGQTHAPDAGVREGDRQ